MAYNLSTEKQATAVSMLCEGSSIRSVERMTDIHRDTIMRLGIRVGLACRNLLDETMRELPCKAIEVDEIWGFVGKKQRNVREGDASGTGDVWTWIAIDPETKTVPVFHVGKRDASDAEAFISNVAGRVKNRIQISSDALNSYPNAIEAAFGNEVDYGQIVKTYSSTEVHEGSRRYSPPKRESIRRSPIFGNPDPTLISTSIVERQNLTMRMHCRRLTRLTNAFSKKLENFQAAVALHFGYYNFVKVHSSVRCTPAMAVGASSRLWSVADLVALTK